MGCTKHRPEKCRKLRGLLRYDVKLSADVEGRQEMSADEDLTIVCATKNRKNLSNAEVATTPNA